jgi:hypothetical protein
MSVIVRSLASVGSTGEVAAGALIAMDGPEALDSLRAGRIDAMVAVAGRPVRFLREAGRVGDCRECHRDLSPGRIVG